MSAHPTTELAAYAARGLAADERARLERHLSECAACRAQLDEFRGLLAELAATQPAPPEVAWPRYAAEIRARRDARAQHSWRARWLRPLPLAAATAAAAACAILLYVVPANRPAMDLASMEYDGLAARMELIDKYRVVEQLDLLEDFEVIRNLDRVTATREG